MIEVGEVFFWIRFLRRYRVTTGAEGMIGERAEVIGPGRVRVPRRDLERAQRATVRGRATRSGSPRSTGSRWWSSPSRG